MSENLKVFEKQVYIGGIYSNLVNSQMGEHLIKDLNLLKESYLTELLQESDEKIHRIIGLKNKIFTIEEILNHITASIDAGIQANEYLNKLKK